ncbi:DNA polymerase IV [Candidatus Kuenenbacteria bacterium]|nr:DNA polymerase IV [Candidatus Kuenenbacteria bacterium]
MPARIIFHIDMDSYFATVEQQARPYLRGKPIVVSGKEGSRSVIVASSKEAKKLGVKTAMLHHEARKLCPNLTFVEGDGVKYGYLSGQMIEVFKNYTDKVEVFSIDEAFLDMTGHCQSFKQAIDKAKQIKAHVKQKLGEWVTASVGIANNKLLAKLASGLDKPDGLFLIDQNNLDQVLKKIKLTDFCGIGKRTESNLAQLGIDSIEKLQSWKLDPLVKVFGPSYGNKLYNMARGICHDPVVSYLNRPEAKSVGRSYTLSKNTYDKQEILTVLLHLCEKVGRELRRKKLAGKTVVVYWRYEDFTHAGARKTFLGYLNDSQAFFNLGEDRIKKYIFPKAVRLVGIHVSNLIKDYKQLPLWLGERKQIELLPALDKINDTYGELTIKPAYLLKLKRLKKKVGGFKLPD